MRRMILLCAVASCGSPQPGSPAAAGGAPAAAPQRPPSPTLERVPYTVVPAELGDPGVLARLRHRVRIRELGRAWIDPAGESVDGSHGEVDLVLPVIDEARGRLRVVARDSDRAARLSLWIERGDAWDVIATRLALAGRHGRPRGVWVVPGAPVTRLDAAARWPRVRVRDEAVRIEGHVPPAMIAKVWLAPEGETFAEADHVRVRSRTVKGRRYLSLARGTQIRERGAPRADVIATVEGEAVRAMVVARRGETYEIELDRPFATIRGFVRAADATPGDGPLDLSGTGGGFGFGITHTDRIDVPPTTCLFAAIGGDVAGVQLAASTRLGHFQTATPKWSLVYAGTRWGIASLYVHDVGDDPKQPRWESCADPTASR